MKSIDWPSIAEKLHCESCVGPDATQSALVEIIGTDAIVASVDHYINGGAGSELARSVLWLLRPESARHRCTEVFANDSDIDRRRAAVELLRVIANVETLEWVPKFLSDPDQSIQSWGAGVVDQMLWSGVAERTDCVEVLEAMKGHQSSDVRHTYEFIQGYLTRREDEAKVERSLDAAHESIERR